MCCGLSRTENDIARELERSVPIALWSPGLISVLMGIVDVGRENSLNQIKNIPVFG